MLRMVTQAEYENKIKSYQHQISEYQQKINFLSAERAGNLRHAERTKDYEWGRKQAEVRTDQINSYISRINTAKNDLWEYQKQIAQEEQEQQVLAIRKAISDQVRLEQERIQQSQQNQIIMQQAPPAEPPSEPSAIIEPGNNLTQANILRQNFKLPFHENYLIPIIAVGGFLVLR